LDIAKNVFQVHGIDAAEKVVVAFAVRAPEGTLRVCLINQNITRDERVAIDLERKFTAASMLRLAGPAIDATAGGDVWRCERGRTRKMGADNE
jgi:hypothetical protein